MDGACPLCHHTQPGVDGMCGLQAGGIAAWIFEGQQSDQRKGLGLGWLERSRDGHDREQRPQACSTLQWGAV